jgi:hypothetical protein
MKPQLQLLIWTAAALSLSAVVVAQAVRSDDAVIRRAELEGQPGANVYQAIEALRHEWLEPEDSTGPRPGVVLETRCGDLACLSWLGASDVEAIRFVNSRGSQTEGPDASEGGVIVVTLRAPDAVTPSGDQP